MSGYISWAMRWECSTCRAGCLACYLIEKCYFANICACDASERRMGPMAAGLSLQARRCGPTTQPSHKPISARRVSSRLFENLHLNFEMQSARHSKAFPCCTSLPSIERWTLLPKQASARRPEEAAGELGEPLGLLLETGHSEYHTDHQPPKRHKREDICLLPSPPQSRCVSPQAGSVTMHGAGTSPSSVSRNTPCSLQIASL